MPTAARSADVRKATWDEIDLDEVMWTLPAGRMKGNREYRAPLSENTHSKMRRELGFDAVTSAFGLNFCD